MLGYEFDFLVMFDRVGYVVKGCDGGGVGVVGIVVLDDGILLKFKGWQYVLVGWWLMLYLLGGGGYGDLVVCMFEDRVNDFFKSYVMEFCK